jgi:hypothetical protein
MPRLQRQFECIFEFFLVVFKLKLIFELQFILKLVITRLFYKPYVKLIKH